MAKQSPKPPVPGSVTKKQADEAQATKPDDSKLKHQLPPLPEEMEKAEPKKTDPEPENADETPSEPEDDSEPVQEPEDAPDDDETEDEEDETEDDDETEESGELDILKRLASIEDLRIDRCSPVRRRRVVKLTLGEDDGVDDMTTDIFIIEFAARDMFAVIGQIKNIASRWVDSRPKDVESLIDEGVGIHRVLDVVASAEKDIFEVLEHCLYQDQACKTKFDLDEIASVGELVLILRTVWYVNWEIGTLKKSLAGLLRTT